MAAKMDMGMVVMIQMVSVMSDWGCGGSASDDGVGVIKWWR